MLAFRQRFSDQNRDRRALALEHGRGHVTEILTVGVQRLRKVADNLDAIEVVPVERIGGAWQVAGEHGHGEPQDRASSQAHRRREVEAELEASRGSEAQRYGAGKGGGVAVTDHYERGPSQI